MCSTTPSTTTSDVASDPARTRLLPECVCVCVWTAFVFDFCGTTIYSPCWLPSDVLERTPAGGRRIRLRTHRAPPPSSGGTGVGAPVVHAIRRPSRPAKAGTTARSSRRRRGGGSGTRTPHGAPCPAYPSLHTTRFSTISTNCAGLNQHQLFQHQAFSTPQQFNFTPLH